jgi:hypothetical protein
MKCQYRQAPTCTQFQTYADGNKIFGTRVGIFMREWKRRETKVTEEHCLAGRSCCGRWGCSTVKFEFQLYYRLVYTYIVDQYVYSVPKCTKSRLVTDLLERNYCVSRGVPVILPGSMKLMSVNWLQTGRPGFCTQDFLSSLPYFRRSPPSPHWR